MKSPLKSDPAKKGKNLAQQIAKQMAQEPVEIAKSALKQVTGLESSETGEQKEVVRDMPNENQIENKELLEQKLKAQSQRQIQALENEIKEIAEKKKIKKQQEEVYEEQQKIVEEEESEESLLIEPSSKKPRNIFAVFGRKPKKQQTLQAERQKRRVERVMPPTG